MGIKMIHDIHLFYQHIVNHNFIKHIKIKLEYVEYLIYNIFEVRQNS